MVLTENEIVVETVTNAALVSEAINAQVPNVILLDWDVDGLDGRSILRIIKKNPESRHIPVLVMTNRAVTETLKREMMMYGVQWILEKPIVALSLPKLIIRTAAEGVSMGQAAGFFQRKALLVDFGQTASGAMWKSVW
jgi:DNA-binding response OmpR family regulator